MLDGPGPTTTEEKAANDGVPINSPRGTTADYLTARIARDRPDMLARMKAGAFPSVSPVSHAPCAAPGETWDLLDDYLRAGRRGLPGGSSVAKLGITHTPRHIR